MNEDDSTSAPLKGPFVITSLDSLFKYTYICILIQE